MNAINELSFNDFRQLRVTADLQDDVDFGAMQAAPADFVELRHPGATRAVAPVRIKVELVLEWLDRGDNVITSEGRGSYDIQAIRISQRQGIGGDVISDSAVVRGQMAHRPVIVDDLLAGDLFSVRLTNMLVGPPSVEATMARVLYREIF